MIVALPFSLEIALRQPELLWLLMFLPILWLLAIWEGRLRKKTLQDPWIQLHIASAHLPRMQDRLLWWVGTSMALVLLIAALVAPDRKITHWKSVYGMVRVTFLLDSSLSMKWGEDVEPNRLAAAKVVMEEFVNALWLDTTLQGSYAVALIPFAGAAQPVYLPFTTSREQILSHLEAINEQTVRKKGTSLLAALRAYDELLLARPVHEKGTVDLAIFISDGGKEEGKGTEQHLLPEVLKELLDPYRMAAIINDIRTVIRSNVVTRTVIVNTVGVGKVEIDAMGNRVSIPVPLIIRDKAGNFLDYYREEERNPKSPVLRSRLDEDILRDIAKLGHGAYMHFSEEEKLLQEFKALVLRHRLELEKIPEVQYEPLRAWFAASALLLCFILFGYAEPYTRIVKKYLRFAAAKQ